MSTMLLGTYRATSVRIFTPYTGAWVAEVDFDLEAVPTEPSGKTTLKIGLNTILVGTIDKNGAGKFGERGHARVIGGGAGWFKNVRAQDFSNPAGVLSSAVFTATASEVGEVATDLKPSILGTHYVRTMGPASRVLDGRDWYVNPTGVTIIGPRAPVPANPLTVEVLNWDPIRKTAEIASDELIQPGMILVDSRFGKMFVRDVEQTFDASGSRATAWCESELPSKAEGAKLLKMLRTVATQGNVYNRPHRYRVVSQDLTGRYILQAVKVGGEVPDVLPVVAWPGVPGMTAKALLGSEVLVEFAGGDPSEPVVTHWGDGAPLEVTFSAVVTKFGLGTSPLALATGVAAAINALQTEIAALGSALAALAADPTHVSPSTATAVSAAASALTAGATAVSAAATALVSKRTFSD